MQGGERGDQDQINKFEMNVRKTNREKLLYLVDNDQIVAGSCFCDARVGDVLSLDSHDDGAGVPGDFLAEKPVRHR